MPPMAKRKPAKPTRNRDLEALSAVAGGAGFFLLSPLLLSLIHI